MSYLCCVFFFSSRRRHTRWPRDWSSDVCSSDLNEISYYISRSRRTFVSGWLCLRKLCNICQSFTRRSEERRVGKECGYKGGKDQEIEIEKSDVGGEGRRGHQRKASSRAIVGAEI